MRVHMQGYLKVTVSITGPGENIIVHNDDPLEEVDIDDLAMRPLMPPSINLVYWKLQVEVYRCENIVSVDPCKL